MRKALGLFIMGLMLFSLFAIRPVSAAEDQEVSPIVVVGDKVYFNPFAIREVRYAMNWLISRNYIVQNIYQGSGAPALSGITPSDPAAKYFTPVYSALGISADGNEQLAIQMIDNAMKKAAEEVAKYGYKLEKRDDGYWYFQGEPVTVKFVIRTEDERKDLGLYVADILEKKVGFKVDRMLLDRQKASEIVFRKPMTTYEWNLYTGGWGAGGLGSMYPDWQIYYWYSPLGYYPNFIDPRHEPDVTVEDALKYIGGGDVNAGLKKLETTYYKSADDLGPILKWTTKEIGYLLLMSEYEDPETGEKIVLNNADQYWDLQKIGLTIGLMDSVRVFLVEAWEFYPVNKERVTDIISDPSVGIASKWSIMSAKTPDKQLKVAQFASTGALFMSAINPVGGITDVYSTRLWNLIHDTGGTINFDGIYVPYRCKWELEKGEFTVPEDAVIYNQTQGWIAAHAGEKAKVKVKVTCDLGEWHNGVKMTMDDIKNYIAFYYAWAFKDSEDDPYYDGALSSTAATLQTYLGFQFTDDGYVVYGNYVHPFADDLTAGNYIMYPDMPWELYWAMGELVAKSDKYGASSKYSFSSSGEGLLQLDLLTEQQVADLAKVMQAIMDGKVAEGLPKDIPLTSDEAKTRFEADLNWYNEYKHFVISNGPYILAMYAPENLYLKLEKFTGERNTFQDDPKLPKDGYADVIEYQGVQNPENVILQIAKGEFDLGLFAFGAKFYKGLGEDVLAKLNLYKSASSSAELSINPYGLPWSEVPQVPAETPTETETPAQTESPTQTQTPAQTESPTQTEGGGGICGPAAFLGLVIVPLLLRRRR